MPDTAGNLLPGIKATPGHSEHPGTHHGVGEEEEGCLPLKKGASKPDQILRL
jgi:hypothetical protein